MAEAKTQPTQASVAGYLDARATPEQRLDCEALMGVLSRVTGSPPTMWGPSIVGFGRYAYTYASGRTGEACLTGFAVRGRELVVYLVASGPHQDQLLPRLGKHKLGKACLYFKRLADLDLAILEQLVLESVAEVRRRHPCDG